MTEHEDWLALIKEEAIDPELPICDPHHHLWDLPGDRYLLEELFRDLSGGHNIVQTVFVECESIQKKNMPEEIRPVEETKFVDGVANQNADGKYGITRVAAGIVGFADLTMGNAVAPLIEAHIAASKRFRGIRQVSSWDANRGIFSPSRPGLLSDGKFREGLLRLKDYGISFETFLYHPQLIELVDLARDFPDIPIILDHIGGPLYIGPYARKRDEVFEEWKYGMAEMATCPNVFVKLGGLGMPICGFGWSELKVPPGSAELADAMTPYFLWCIEKFGVARCMFESNFPVDRGSYSYTVLWNAFKRITMGFSREERAALFHDTAARAYRL